MTEIKPKEKHTSLVTWWHTVCKASGLHAPDDDYIPILRIDKNKALRRSALFLVEVTGQHRSKTTGLGFCLRQNRSFGCLLLLFLKMQAFSGTFI